MKYRILFLLLCGCCLAVASVAQKKTAAARKGDSSRVAAADTGKIKPHSPRKATIRSAILPGWGQAYNKKYWKIPIVYGALGTCAGIFVYNVNDYQAARDAYRFKVDNDPSNDNLIQPKFRPVDAEAVRQYRNAVRQNVDYSVLAFLVLWGLNVVDATVDGHLRSFNVNENLSLRVNPGYLPQTRQPQLSVIMTFGKKHSAR